MTMTTQNEAAEIAQAAVKMKCDINGNPRYYVPCYHFRTAPGKYFRPAFANMYRGKKFGAGWVFQSYSLENDIRRSIEASEVTA